MTSAIDFIEQDIAKARGQGLKAAALAAAVVVFSLGLALVRRPDYEDINAFYIGQSLVLGAVLFAFICLYLSPSVPTKVRSLVWKVAVVLSLALSLAHEGLHGFSQQGSFVRFWKEAGACFGFGLIAGLVAGTILTIGAFRLMPMPDRRWQLGIAASASLAGVVTLNLHCPSTVAAHIVFGHWAQALLVTAIVVQWQAALFRRQIKQIVGPSGATSGALDSLEE